MPDIWIRPDLRTAGGETNDIVVDGKYAGNMTLVYREGRRLSGSILLDQEQLPGHYREPVIQALKTYIQSLLDACGVPECEIFVQVGKVNDVISTEGNAGILSTGRAEDEPVDTQADRNMDTRPANRRHTGGRAFRPAPSAKGSRGIRTSVTEHRARKRRHPDALYYELVAVGENGRSLEYQIYDRSKGEDKFVAEVFVTAEGREVTGEVNWLTRPGDFEIESAVDLIVSDFDDNEFDLFLLDMKYKDELLETVELVHDDLIEDEADDPDDEIVYGEGIDDDINIVLVRDDGDTLTYDIYRQTRGGLPLATATVDISRRDLSGYIDFHDATDEEEREEIAVCLMKELDKEKDYDKFNLTMLENNEWIDEIQFENELVR